MFFGVTTKNNLSARYLFKLNEKRGENEKV